MVRDRANFNFSSKFQKLIGHTLLVSVNADTKSQLHIFPFDRVTYLDVQTILVYKVNVW